MTRALPPAERYAQMLGKPGFAQDPAQARAVAALQRIHDELIAKPPRRFRKLPWPEVKGLYLWGGVGRGKTWLVDGFYDSLPFSKKSRLHFHRFMLDVHARLKSHPDEVDPLKRVAKDIASSARVLCFDEFFVSDIADAMILGRLTEALFDLGVTLVATSNVVPKNLYKDGLQRERFLPAIARLEAHCEVLHLDSPTDYRLRALTHAEIFHSPSDAAAEKNLADWFEELAAGASHGGALEVLGRRIEAKRLAEGVAWFEFAPLCRSARSAADYIEIARTHHTVLVSRMPQLGADDEDAARRFISMVDEFYDRGVKLILAADATLQQLYAGRKLAFEFERTRSRLTEMQSQEYLARPHLP